METRSWIIQMSRSPTQRRREGLRARERNRSRLCWGTGGRAKTLAEAGCGLEKGGGQLFLRVPEGMWSCPTLTLDQKDGNPDFRF